MHVTCDVIASKNDHDDHDFLHSAHDVHNDDNGRDDNDQKEESDEQEPYLMSETKKLKDWGCSSDTVQRAMSLYRQAKTRTGPGSGREVAKHCLLPICAYIASSQCVLKLSTAIDWLIISAG